MTKNSETANVPIEPGEGVYDNSGQLLGFVSGFTEEGFETETIDTGDEHGEEIPGQEFGEGHLMWRCTECGEMGQLEDGLPESCPNCGAEKEAITNAVED